MADDLKGLHVDPKILENMGYRTSASVKKIKVRKEKRSRTEPASADQAGSSGDPKGQVSKVPRQKVVIPEPGIGTSSRGQHVLLIEGVEEGEKGPEETVIGISPQSLLQKTKASRSKRKGENA